MKTLEQKELLKMKLFRRVKTGEQFTFKELMQINSDRPEVIFLLNEEGKKKYIECLEAWC